jgi:NAD-dependent deacetylase
VKSIFIDWLKTAKHAVVFTGAGMSTESGLPDFTQTWKGTNPRELTTITAIERNRMEFIEFYTHRIKQLHHCEPHKGHVILAEWERQGLIKGIITQNVDGFHHRAGSEKVAELHGTLSSLHCDDCKKSYSNSLYIEGKSSCQNCGGFLRPSVILFGERLPEEAFLIADEVTAQADLFIVLGSSLLVSPANEFPLIAKQNGAKLVIINNDQTEYDQLADLVINDKKIGELLKELETS